MQMRSERKQIEYDGHKWEIMSYDPSLELYTLRRRNGFKFITEAVSKHTLDGMIDLENKPLAHAGLQYFEHLIERYETQLVQTQSSVEEIKAAEKNLAHAKMRRAEIKEALGR